MPMTDTLRWRTSRGVVMVVRHRAGLLVAWVFCVLTALGCAEGKKYDPNERRNVGGSAGGGRGVEGSAGGAAGGHAGGTPTMGSGGLVGSGGLSGAAGG